MVKALRSHLEMLLAVGRQMGTELCICRETASVLVDARVKFAFQAVYGCVGVAEMDS